MAGFAKGMATTSGWALVLCDCRIRIQQDRTLMDRSRATKMAAAACNGDDVQDRASMDRSRAMKMAAAAGNGVEQDRIEGSIAQDPADGDDSISFRVTNFFQSIVDAAVHRTSEL